MKVLLFGQWYRPEPAYGLQDIAQVLQKKGHEVTVLTGFPNYPVGKVYPGYRMKLWQKEILNDVPVIRVPLYPDHSDSKIRRSLNYLTFALSSSILGPLLASRPDIIFVYHPPLTVGVPAYLMSKIWRVPFIYQIQDMWPETLLATNMISNPKLLKAIDGLARRIYHWADAICVISPGFKRNLLDKGVSPEKIFVIPNWVDTQKYYRAPVDNELARRLGLQDRFNIMFAGNIGEAQGLETIIRAAKRLENISDIQFVFVGDGIAVPKLKNLIAEMRLSNVIFLGRFPAEVMPQIYALADVLLVHLKDDPLFRITIPHKVLSYMAVGKPILAAVEGDTANMIQETGSGLTCEPENPDALVAATLEFYKMSETQRRAIGQRGFEAAMRDYKKETLVTQIENLMLSLVQNHS